MESNKKQWLRAGVVFAIVLGVGLLTPDYAHADIQSSLQGLQFKLTAIVLPLLSVIGIGFAALSFFTGNPQAKQHIIYAILGCCFGFGAQAIVDMIRSTVQ